MTVHFDNPRWQDGGSCGPFAGRPVEVRNGIPWKPYTGIGTRYIRALMALREAEEAGHEH